MPRQYNQFCALARALDAVGERWTLLIVRELLLGPRRFNELARSLPGIGRNLLAARVRELEGAGIVERRPPGYHLTERGRGLEDALFALTRWEMAEMRPPAPDDELRAGWYVLAMRSAFQPEAAPRGDATYELRIDGEVFHLGTRSGRPFAGRGPADDPDAVLEAGLGTMLGLATGLDDLTAATRSGRARASGSASALRRGLRAFPLPAPRAA